MQAKNAPMKKVPVRMCTGCREHKPKKELIRVVRSPQGEISLDFVGKNQDAAHIFARTDSVWIKPEKQDSWNGRWKLPFPMKFISVWKCSFPNSRNNFR